MNLRKLYWTRRARNLYKHRKLEAVPTSLGVCITNVCNIRCRYLLMSPLNIIGFDYMAKASCDWGDCYLAWDSMFIEPNGSAYFCHNYEYVVGNVFKEDHLKIRNSPRAQESRRNLPAANPPLGSCHSCNFARGVWRPDGAYMEQKADKKDIT